MNPRPLRRRPALGARLLALACLVGAVLAAGLADRVAVRVAAVAGLLGVGWVAAVHAARRGGFGGPGARGVPPASGWVRPSRRTNPRLRALTDTLLLYVREVHALGRGEVEGTRDPERAATRLAEVEREMTALVRELVDAGRGPGAG